MGRAGAAGRFHSWQRARAGVASLGHLRVGGAWGTAGSEAEEGGSLWGVGPSLLVRSATFTHTTAYRGVD